MPRPAAGLTAALSAASLVCALLGGAPAVGQTVAGRIVDADGGAGVSGAFVVLADSAGRRRGAVLSDGEGRFLLTAPNPGRYTVRAERIGMTTRTVPAFTLAPGERRSFAITLAADAVPLAAIEVAAKRRRCELRPDAGEATARVWEEVRKPLRVSSWARSAGALNYTIHHTERTLELPSHTVQKDSSWEISGYGARPFTSAPADELAREGYVRGSTFEGFSYWGPDDDVLGSDEFLDTHCLQLRPADPGQPNVLAIDFKPARRTGPVDIEGTAWLDARSRELRYIDFHYAGLPFKERAEEAGGSVYYRRLPSGVWIVERFRLAFPLLRALAGARLSLSALQTRAPEQRLEAYAVRETLSEVVDMRPPGGTRPVVPEDSARLGAVTGEVYDSLRGRPLSLARVYLSGTSRSAMADSLGRFRMAGVAPGRYAVAFDQAAMDSLPVRPAPVEAVVVAGAEASVLLAIPSARTLAARACPHATEPGGSVVLFGVVADAGSGVTVQATWSAVTKEGTHISIRRDGVQVSPEAAGRYVVCGAPAEQEITLRTVRQALSGAKLLGEPQRVTPARGTLQRVDLKAPKS